MAMLWYRWIWYYCYRWNKGWYYTRSIYLLINAYDQFKSKTNNVCEELARALELDHIAPTASFISKDTIYEEAYLPLYSYKHKEVEPKSGLNAWNAAPKNKGSTTLRPLNEVYIPIPREFHKRYPHFFINNIFKFEEIQSSHQGAKENKPEIRFKLVLPMVRLYRHL